MSNIQIAREAFPWDAIATFTVAGATLITGSLAVAAAYFVGLKQANISSQQVKILDRQLIIQQLSLRQALFDRQFAVHQATLELVREAIKKRNFPEETDQEFLEQREVARFLFSPEVVLKLTELRKKLIELEFQKNTAEDPKLRKGALENSGKIVKELLAMYPDQIADIFLEEMAIKQPKAP